jgi:hypothetical protein
MICCRINDEDDWMKRITKREMTLLSYKRANIFLCIFAAVLAFGIVSAHATEVDSYSFTRFIREDAVMEINREINELIETAIGEANLENLADPEDLYEAIHKVLGGFIITRLEEILEQKDDGRILRVDIRDSIYSDLWAFWAPSLMLSQKIGGVFKAGEYIIGTDKLGHFVSQGYTYFKICCLQGEDLEKAMLYGINSELTYFGFAATGIFSYGDLVANFQGIRFWNDLLGGRPDILGLSQMPYIQKQSGRWVLVNPVDMRRYFDAGWDERINRNMFRNPMIEDEVNTKIHQAPASSPPLSSDSIQTRLSALQKKYKEYSVYLLNTGNLRKEHIAELREKLKLVLKNRVIQRNKS